jgi:uncharacterized protein YqfA (UPF0365 family)
MTHVALINLLGWLKTVPPSVWVSALSAVVFVALQVAYAIRLDRRLRVAAEVSQKLDRLTAGLGLLTDTTEGGLGALAAEVERLSRRTVVSPAARTRPPVQIQADGSVVTRNGDSYAHVLG